MHLDSDWQKATVMHSVTVIQMVIAKHSDLNLHLEIVTRLGFEKQKAIERHLKKHSVIEMQRRLRLVTDLHSVIGMQTVIGKHSGSGLQKVKVMHLVTEKLKH